MMTLSLIYPLYFLFRNPFNEINSPLSVLPVEGKFSGNRVPPSVQPEKMYQRRLFF